MKLLSPPTTYHQQHYSSSSLFFANKLHFSFPLFSPCLKLKSTSRWVPRMYSTTTVHHHHHHHHHQDHGFKREKIIVIMGATGTGKSKLSIDLATRFNAEIINTDKIQVYKGLDITTNKIPINERKGIQHHLLGEFDEHQFLTPSLFRSLAGLSVNHIVSRKKLPFLVGGSNSLIHAVLVNRFDPEFNVFDGCNSNSVSSELRYNCCFLWVDVSLSLLYDYLCKRVDDMLDSGMFKELTEFYQTDSVSQPGITQAIGVPEFSTYFKRYPPKITGMDPEERWDCVRRGVYEKAVREIKNNTCQLAKRQIGKIERLRGAGWGLHRLDATEAFRKVMTSADYEVEEEWRDIWERQVLGPSVKIVKRFLEE